MQVKALKWSFWIINLLQLINLYFKQLINRKKQKLNYFHHHQILTH